MKKRTMRAVHETMGVSKYIRIGQGGYVCPVCRSRLKKKDRGPATRLAYAVGTLIEGGACAGMVYMIARMAGIIPV